MTTLTATDVTFRPATEKDLEFLRALRLATMREVVLRHRPWREEEQDQRVMAHFDSGRIILREGREIGLLKVVREADHFHLVQIQLLPDFQGRGIGTAIIQSLQEECGALGLPIVLEVYLSNRSIDLYSRLGFAIVERVDRFCTMRWQRKINQPNKSPDRTPPSGVGQL